MTPSPSAFWTLLRLAFRAPALVSPLGAGSGLWFRARLDIEGPPNIVAGQSGGVLAALLDHFPELGIAPEQHLFKILTLDTDYDRSGFTSAGDQNTLVLRLVDERTQVRLCLFQTDEFHRISLVVL
jgi:hypothetical protein